MSFGPDIKRHCISTISTPFTAYAVFTMSVAIYDNSDTTFTYYSGFEYRTTSDIDSTSRFESLLSNITTVTSALAVALPVEVVWVDGDLASFPAPYATSLANKIGVALMPRPQDAPTLPRETGTSSTSSGLSTGAKAGIGVGSTVGAIAITAIIVLL